jgi:protein O-mannosyl-transferase
MSGDLPKAMSDARFAITMEKNNARAHFVLGNCYNDLNKLDEALAEYNLCLRINKDETDYYFKRAIVFGKKQEFNSSLNDLTVCTQLNPKYYEAYYWKGVVKVNLKQDPCEDLKIAAENNYEPAIKAYANYCQ